ncbi:MAG: mannonate dehydratase [Candidatus Latescibacterota bacterium]|nr:mannonate dehydratase [Candidatus Latescibacterota bacterium]
MKISLPLPELSRDRLNLYARLGVEAVSVPWHYSTEFTDRSPKPLVPPAARGAGDIQPDPPDVDELRRICDRIRHYDLHPRSTSLPISRAILTGAPDSAADLDKLQRTLEVIGTAGITVATTNFTALRASEGYSSRDDGRGSATVRDFDAARIDTLPPLDDIGVHTRQQMWERLERFLHAAVPAAEAAGVVMAMHPNDPPVPVFRGVGQPLIDFADMCRLVECVDSPANSIYYDCGVATEWGEDAAKVADWFASRGRIAAAHIRSVQIEEAGRRYTECFLDEGDNDVPACLRALHGAGYAGCIDPDHTPGFSGDDVGMTMGWAWAVGTLRAYRNQVTAA